MELTGPEANELRAARREARELSRWARTMQAPRRDPNSVLSHVERKATGIADRIARVINDED